MWTYNHANSWLLQSPEKSHHNGVNFDSLWLPITTSGVVDTVFSSPSIHCTLTPLSDSVYTSRAQSKVGPVVLSKLPISQWHWLSFFNQGIKYFPLLGVVCSMNAHSIHAANYSNLTSSIVPSMSSMSSLAWQGEGLPHCHTEGYWQGMVVIWNTQ